MTQKTYLFRFDGEYLCSGDCRPMTIIDEFDTTDKKEIFDSLFYQDSLTRLGGDFEYMFELAEGGDDMFGCPGHDMDVFVNYYREKGYEQFFQDVDETWQYRQSSA